MNPSTLSSRTILTLMFALATSITIAAGIGGCRQDRDGQEKSRTTRIPDQPPEHDAPPRQPVQ
jgi:hypothetical protein